jgi:UDP-2-acetamido-2-deoxy-ribo-hexuluronate aminotransferase
MEFRDLRRQYAVIKPEIDNAIADVISSTHFIMGTEVQELEQDLAEYVGVKECISCANGTDALQLALMVWNVGPGDAVFVPDFTFFSSGEVVAAVGATPIFVNVYHDTFNISTENLEECIEDVVNNTALNPKVIIAVDLFGLPADYEKIRAVAKKYDLKILEDGAQGFGGAIGTKKACSFGDISTTSFFPAKPLGCYGDGGAVFTDNNDWADLLRSYRVHGKGKTKYDNVRIGMNSRLDTMQAAILKAKLPRFVNRELVDVQEVADWYDENLVGGGIKLPVRPDGFKSSFAQYTIRFDTLEIRERVKRVCLEKKIPIAVYYSKPMHLQTAFEDVRQIQQKMFDTESVCNTVLSLPFHPYMERGEVLEVCRVIKENV